METIFYNTLKDDFIEMYNSNMSIKDIQKHFNVSNTTFYRLLKKFNIKPNRNNYVLHERDNNVLKEFFSEEKYIPLSNDLRNDESVNFNECYFDNDIDQDKAYMIGLFLADGNIAQNNKCFSISLQEKDFEILDKIRLLLNSKKELAFISLNHKNKNWQNQYCLRLCSKHFCRALEFYNIIPNKSLKLQFPTNLPLNMYRHLLRGYIDGDGNLSKSTRDRKVRIISTKDFCELMKIIIENNLNINCFIKNCKNNDITKELVISGGKQTKIFLNWIYEDANLFLKRKYDIYQKYYT